MTRAMSPALILAAGLAILTVSCASSAKRTVIGRRALREVATSYGVGPVRTSRRSPSARAVAVRYRSFRRAERPTSPTVHRRPCCISTKPPSASRQLSSRLIGRRMRLRMGSTIHLPHQAFGSGASRERFRYTPVDRLDQMRSCDSSAESRGRRPSRCDRRWLVVP